MKYLDGILDMVDQELGSIVQSGQFRSRDDVHSAYELVDIAKDVFCIWKHEEDDEGYSEEYSMNNRGNYNRDGNYARGRGRNARRDAMGRYSREGSYRGGSSYDNYDGSNYERGGSYRGGNYRRGGYSRDDAKKEYAENLRKMMEEAPDEQTKQSIQRMVENLEREQ